MSLNNVRRNKTKRFSSVAARGRRGEEGRAKSFLPPIHGYIVDRMYKITIMKIIRQKCMFCK